MLPTGTVLRSRYRIMRLLGQGGMGAVYQAWDLSLNIPVALKEMLPQPGVSPSALSQWRAQFQQEARVLAVLSHPCLPRVTDHFTERGGVYLVMDFVEGESLDRYVRRVGALPEEQVARWAVQLLDALALCHKHRVVHRDIKPQNIIIRPTGEAVLVDFGLVKRWDPRDPRTRSIVQGMGTYEYASPEHFYIAGHHTEPRSDLYSLGATLYYALTGREPPSALNRWTQRAPLIPPRQLGVRIRPQLESTLMRALEMDIQRRWPDARQMQQSIQMAMGITPYTLPSVAGAGRGTPAAPEKRPAVFRGTVLLREARWLIEMATGMLMALLGVLAVDLLIFAPWMTFALYVGRSISALVLGALGWFLGDLIFQALTRPETAASVTSSYRPTQQLVAFSRQLVRRLTPAQQVVLLTLLVVGAAILVWLLAPPISRIPLVVNNVSFYALVAPFTYAAVGRRPGRAAVAHILVLTVSNAIVRARVSADIGMGPIFIAAFVGGLLMEGLAFLAERTVIRP